MASRIFVDGDSKFLRSIVQIFKVDPDSDIQIKVNGEFIDLEYDADSMVLSFFLNDTWNQSNTPVASTLLALKEEIRSMMDGKKELYSTT